VLPAWTMGDVAEEEPLGVVLPLAELLPAAPEDEL
jgi:hypothetical protein